MATKEDQEALRLLVQHVSRAFYEPKFIVIMDQLTRHPVLKDDDLAGRIGLQAKELNKLLAVLLNDRLVQVHRQNELKEGAQRSIGRQYYYIDYQHFCNVVKWRVSEMRRIIDSTLRNELDNKGYICPNCRATYTPLDVDRLMDFNLGMFVCDQCTNSPGAPHEVVTNEDAENIKGSKDRMERFNRQTRFIREGLKKSESMVLPAFDVALWVKVNVPDSAAAKAGGQPGSAAGGGLKIAGAGSAEQNAEKIGIVMSVDKDEETRKRERQQEAESKRVANALPTWHLQSTISGDLTALGIKHATQESAATNGNGPSLNSSILGGLGHVRSNADEEVDVQVVEDAKPDVGGGADYYDAYYASLEASQSRANTVQNTPMIDSPNSDFDDEEDKKPSMEYLDSMGASLASTPGSGKRSRSRSIDEYALSEREVKRSHVDLSMNGDIIAEAPMDGDVEFRDDPIVYVGGQPFPFSQVTQEIATEKMTTEEYTAWYELVMRDES